MKPTDYEAARRLQQTIPLPVRAVLALLKQHGSPEAARAAYRAAQIAHISQTAGCSETEAAEHYDKHQGNTERAIRAILRTPVYLGEPVINGEKSGYAITPLDEKGNEAAGRHAFIQSENSELIKPLFAPYFPRQCPLSGQEEHGLNPTSDNCFPAAQCLEIAVRLRQTASGMPDNETARLFLAAAAYLETSCRQADCRYLDFYGTL